MQTEQIEEQVYSVETLLKIEVAMLRQIGACNDITAFLKKLCEKTCFGGGELLDFGQKSVRVQRFYESNPKY